MIQANTGNIIIQQVQGEQQQSTSQLMEEELQRIEQKLRKQEQIVLQLKEEELQRIEQKLRKQLKQKEQIALELQQKEQIVLELQQKEQIVLELQQKEQEQREPTLREQELIARQLREQELILQQQIVQQQIVQQLTEQLQYDKQIILKLQQDKQKVLKEIERITGQKKTYSPNAKKMLNAIFIAYKNANNEDDCVKKLTDNLKALGIEIEQYGRFTERAKTLFNQLMFIEEINAREMEVSDIDRSSSVRNIVTTFLPQLDAKSAVSNYSSKQGAYKTPTNFADLVKQQQQNARQGQNQL